MATIIGGIASSHSPTIGFAFDRDKRSDPVWAPIFEAFDPVRAWIADQRPEVLLFIYNDHVTSFFFDHYSAFALGVGEQWSVADEGGGARALPPVAGHPALARHVAQSLVADEFDMAFFQDKALDHGCFSPLSMMCELEERRAAPSSSTPSGGGLGLPSPGGADERGWPVAVVPLQIGVLQFPIPSAARCWKLGQALRRAVESYPEDLRVAIVATGGLSHQVHGERAGFNNTAWDHEFLTRFEQDPARLAQMTHAELAELGGFEGAEVIMWLVMRGALSAQVRKVHQHYYLPSMAGIAVAVFENLAAAPAAGELRRHAEHMATQLRGVEKLAGTYPFNLERSVKAYRLSRFLHDLIVPAHREAFLRDPEQAFEAAGLSAEERELVRRRDWRGLIHYGVIFFMLEKLGAVVGVSNLHLYAAMRGESLEDFQKTRNAPNALYSVAGKTPGGLAWDTTGKPTPGST